MPEFAKVKGLELLSAPDNAIIPSRLAETTNKNGGKECGEFVNDVVGKWLMGNTIQDKLAVAKETTGKQWSVAVWTPNPNNKAFAKYWHTGIIMGDAGDNWIIRSSNLNGDGRVTTNYVPKSAIQGYKSTNLTA